MRLRGLYGCATVFSAMNQMAYHSIASSTDRFDFARAVETAVDGFVPHGAYVQRAAANAQGGQTPVALARRIAASSALDANPIAELLLGAPDATVFATRWNGFNRSASLGVRTFIGSDGLRREPRGADDAFRAELIAEVIPRLTPCQRLDTSHRLCQLYDKDDVIRDVLEGLYQSPALNLNETAARLGCSRRTLQRGLVGGGLTFRGLRQAVRVTLAGYQLRQPAGSVTDIAHRCGFFDSAHFVRAWRRACSMAPSAYRDL
ncbi:MAG: helix-turn-helix domain-containing protein, partial [Polyangiaceae bacterium]